MTMKQTELEAKIQSLDPKMTLMVRDTAGDENHYYAVVISDIFEGLNKIKRHQRVFESLREELHSGKLHALELKTLTQSEYVNLEESNK